jgi:predicted  nucleic acid-binding Zn-ribbon protein
MWHGLEALIELQRMDQAIARLEAEARQIPLQIAALEADLGRARAAWDQGKATAAATAKERRERERELEEEAGNQRKKQGRLFEIKTNQEYAAVLKEIEQVKERISGLETRILELMDEQEQAGKRATEAEAAFRAAEALHRRDREAREKDLGRLQGELAGLQKARKQVAGTVDRELYQNYARIMKIRDGTAVVPVREGSCAGCFVALPPQTCNEVRLNDRRITCPHCERILYYPFAGVAAEGGVRTDAAVP